MKRKKVVENLETCQNVVTSHYYGLSNAQIDRVTSDLQIALDEAIKAVKENKKLKEKNEKLKKKVRDLEYELEYGDSDGYMM